MKKDKEQIEQRNRQLREWACNYHSASFIESDPVQFPHRYVLKQDIEISGLLTAILSFGNRRQILKKADQLDEMMGHAPLRYVLSECWKEDFREGDRRSFYRMLSYAEFRIYFEKLYSVYASGRPWRMCCWNMTALRCSGCVLFWEFRIAVRRRS